MFCLGVPANLHITAIAIAGFDFLQVCFLLNAYCNMAFD
jgi:hypothetical protein